MTMPSDPLGRAFSVNSVRFSALLMGFSASSAGERVRCKGSIDSHARKINYGLENTDTIVALS